MTTRNLEQKNRLMLARSALSLPLAACDDDLDDPGLFELLTIHPARKTWQFARCKLTTLPKSAKVPFYHRVTDSEGPGHFTNAEAALQGSLDGPLP